MNSTTRRRAIQSGAALAVGALGACATPGRSGTPDKVLFDVARPAVPTVQQLRDREDVAVGVEQRDAHDGLRPEAGLSVFLATRRAALWVTFAAAASAGSFAADFAAGFTVGFGVELLAVPAPFISCRLFSS